MRTLLRLICLGVLSLSTAQAWDADGHLLVATIAYDHLNPKAKAELEKLAPQIIGVGKTYDAITLACWMDDLRPHDSKIPYQGMFLSWHYVDMGISPRDRKPDFEPGHDNELKGNVVTALKRAMIVLQGGTDPYIKDKAMAAAMAMHLVGDIHQPLHAGTAYHQEPDGHWKNDAGGTRVAILNPPVDEPVYNLHYYWDAAWRASLDPANGNLTVDQLYPHVGHQDPVIVRPLAEEWEVKLKPDASAQLEPNFVAWAEESNQIAREIVYPKLAMVDIKQARISAEYIAITGPLARERIVLAGYRLATLLNATLGAETPGPAPASYPAGPPAVKLTE